MHNRGLRDALPELGTLELRVLECLWACGEGDAKALGAALGGGRSLSTVQSTLNRLYRKGLLGRDKQGHAYRYRPLQSRQDLIGLALNDLRLSLAGGAPAPLLLGLLALESAADPALLDRLEDWVRHQRGQAKLSADD